MLTANCVTVTKTVEWATGDPTGFFFFPPLALFQLSFSFVISFIVWLVLFFKPLEEKSIQGSVCIQ